MSREDLDPILDGLFPMPNIIVSGDEALAMRYAPEQHELPAVTVKEVQSAFKGKKPRATAPGPDGVTVAVWKMATPEVMELVAQLFTRCLREGIVPRLWKKAKLVLLPKQTTPPSPPKYRPICLLNDISKAYERVIESRLDECMKTMTNEGLSKAQFGFRKGRSTIEALLEVTGYVESAVAEQEFVVAIGLDVVNAFNSLPWPQIIDQLRSKGFPDYLVRVIDSYLSDRTVCMVTRGGIIYERNVYAGVPQGSVLGPLLWNLTFDWVLGAELRPGCRVICYADDTLVLARGPTPQAAAINCTVAAAVIAERIRSLGLQIAPQKTEAILFSKRKGTMTPLTVQVCGTSVVLEDTITFLGVMLDRTLTYRPHLAYVADKANRVVRALMALMPNLKGPRENKRQLYVNMLHSVILYAAPVWSGKVEKYKTYRTALLQVQRNMALRVICAYRTVSYDASLLLARVPPIHLLAARQRRIYERLHSRFSVIDHEGEMPIANAESREEIWEAANILMLRQWRIYLDNAIPQGKRTKDAIMPVFDLWVSRGFGNLNYHLTQILTGHGSFQQYLCRIGKAETEGCSHCESTSDSVEHTLGECPAWELQRETLKAEVGTTAVTKDLRSLVSCMLQDRSAWRAVSTFAIQVITAKEAAEHEAECGRGEEMLLQRRRRRSDSSSSSSFDTGDAVVPDGNGDHG